MTNPLAGLVLGQDFAGVGPMADEKVKPVPRQFNVKPGDHCVALTSDSMVDKELSLLTVLDPEEHKDTFPDYEERLMRSYVLCDWVGQMDPVPAIGWFARSRLLPLTEGEWQEIKAGTEDPRERNFPDWFFDKFRDLTDELAANQPDMVHRLAKCGKCGSREVELHWTVEFEGRTRAHVRNEGDTEVYVANEEDMRATWQAHLHCEDCKATGTLGEEEFQKPNFMKRL